MGVLLVRWLQHGSLTDNKAKVKICTPTEISLATSRMANKVQKSMHTGKLCSRSHTDSKAILKHRTLDNTQMSMVGA